jgi:hypothetical protein
VVGTESGAGKRAAMPESAEEFYARIAVAAGDEGRLAFRRGVEDWETFPLDSPSWRLRPIGPLLDAERPRSAEDVADCWCRRVDADLDHVHAKHGDLVDMHEERAAEMGRLLVVIATAVEALPSVGRAHVCRWGDGSAHLHWWVMGRPARIPQLLGSFLPLWEEYLPRIPAEVRDENVRFVVDRVVDAYGGVPVGAVPDATPDDG